MTLYFATMMVNYQVQAFLFIKLTIYLYSFYMSARCSLVILTGLPRSGVLKDELYELYLSSIWW